MRLKKLGAALFVVAALSAVLAGSAFATATTTAAKWYTGATEGGVTELSGSQAMTAEQVGSGTFKTTLSGTTLEVSATGVECVGCTISNATTGGGGEGKLKFTGVSVVTPSTCSTTSTIESKALKVEADYMEGESAMVKFVPAAGETNGFATFTLSGASCAIAGNVTPKGTIFGKAENKTGVMRTSQNVSFSESINAAAGGTFKVGEEKAVLTATGKFEAGGKFFGVK
ncbi:MAG: hypothetical protein JST59_20660 [Actinobacteria bacterium]|nr:hypothetical protein [Actinomycetota bacterium]